MKMKLWLVSRVHEGCGIVKISRSRKRCTFIAHERVCMVSIFENDTEFFISTWSIFNLAFSALSIAIGIR